MERVILIPHTLRGLSEIFGHAVSMSCMVTRSVHSAGVSSVFQILSDCLTSSSSRAAAALSYFIREGYTAGGKDMKRTSDSWASNRPAPIAKPTKMIALQHLIGMASCEGLARSIPPVLRHQPLNIDPRVPAWIHLPSLLSVVQITLI
jgi:hypothetical protein